MYRARRSVDALLRVLPRTARSPHPTGSAAVWRHPEVRANEDRDLYWRHGAAIRHLVSKPDYDTNGSSINEETTSSSRRGPQRRSDLSLLDMDSTRIRSAIQSTEDLEELVIQLEEMESLTQGDIEPIVKPLVRACRDVREKAKAADLAERILFNCLARLPSDIAERFEGGRSPLDFSTSLPYPDQELYTTVMSVVGDERSEEAANRANRLFRLLTAEHRAELSYLLEGGKDPDDYPIRAAEPSSTTFKALVRAWAVAGTPTGAKEAEGVLVEMEELSGMRGVVERHGVQQRSTIRQPDVQCYNMVLSAYSRVPVDRYPGVTDRALSLFRRMQHIAGERDGFSLGWFSYHAFLQCTQAFLKSSKVPMNDAMIECLVSITPEIGTVHIPRTFLRMYEETGVHPRSWAFGVLVRALVHDTSSESRLNQADILIRQMTGELPFQDSVEGEAQLSQFWPSQESLVTVSAAWQRSSLPDAREATERIQLIASQSSYLSLHHMHVAMTAWEESRLPEAPHVVEALLDRVLDKSSSIEATGETFAIAMRTWSRSSKNESPRKVEDQLVRMRSLFEESQSPRYLPNETHLDLTLQAWRRLCRDGRQYPGKNGILYPAQHASAHLDDLQPLNDSWDPRNYRHYSTVLNAWAHQVVAGDTTDVFPAREAASLLADMESRSSEPPPAPHCNMVLQACVRDYETTTRRREAYDIALQTFNRGRHDPFSFILVVQAVKILTEEPSDDHLQLIESIVERCRTSGMLTQSLIYEAIEVLGKESMKRFFHFSDTYVDMIFRQRSTQLVRDGKKLRWLQQPPTGLKINNLPKPWSRHSEISNAVYH